MKVKTDSNHLISVLALVGLVACQAPSMRGPQALEADLSAAGQRQLDRETVLTLGGRVLAQALDAGDRSTLETFVRYGEDRGDDAAAIREMARRALAGRVTMASPGALEARVRRLAEGSGVPAVTSNPTEIRFPEDGGIHRLSLTEWWYLNGHLEAGSGTRFGYEFTMFRVGPLLHWIHVALTDESGQHFDYLRAFVPVRDVQTRTGQLDVRFGQQHLWQDVDGIHLQGQVRDGMALDLTLRPRKQPLIINGDGKIDMPEGAYSWYYSLPRLEAEGRVMSRGRTLPVRGLSWLDHQWGPFVVTGRGALWDWFSMQFEDATEYNVFGFRSQRGAPIARYLNESHPDGRGELTTGYRMTRLGWWQSPRTGLYYTTRWRIDRPERGESFELEASNADQELATLVPFLQDPLPTYWEGRMRAVKIDRSGRRIPGVGYCEHFGFARPEGPS